MCYIKYNEAQTTLQIAFNGTQEKTGCLTLLKNEFKFN